MSNTRGCPKNSNIRPMYCPTTYFNQNYPDPYTYLSYWRRRMCYNTYLQYNGVDHIPNATGCSIYDNMIDHTAHALPDLPDIVEESVSTPSLGATSEPEPAPEPAPEPETLEST